LTLTLLYIIKNKLTVRIEGIMNTKIKELPKWVLPAIATAAVTFGGYAFHNLRQAEKAKDPVGTTANLTALLFMAAFAPYTKRLNQLRRDQELGIRDEGLNLTINAGKFGVAKERHEYLDKQAKIMRAVSVGLPLIGITVPAVFPAAIGCGLVLATMGLAARSGEEKLKKNLKGAALNILENSQSNPASVLAEARSFLANLR
jgi:hypothetical protein